MSDKFQFQYELLDHGWASARIRHGDISVDMTASYLHDSLRELANATFAISHGAVETRVVFVDEPGAHQLTLARVTEETCDYSVTWFKDWTSCGIHDSPGSRHICDGTVSVRRILQQVYNAMGSMYDIYGETGYKSRWGNHDFPLQEMRRLIETSSS